MRLSHQASTPETLAGFLLISSLLSVAVVTQSQSGKAQCQVRKWGVDRVRTQSQAGCLPGALLPPALEAVLGPACEGEAAQVLSEGAGALHLRAGTGDPCPWAGRTAACQALSDLGIFAELMGGHCASH